MPEYKTMKEIGQGLAMTSHEVGKRLKALGLRTRDGGPSQEAFRHKLVAQKWTDDHNHYIWAWRGDAIGKLLADATERAS